MSGHLAVIPARAVTDARVTPAALRVLLAIGSHTDRNGWCRVKEDTLATMIGVSRPAVSRQVSVLRKLGYVEVERTGRSSRYRVVLDVPEAAAMKPDVTSDISPMKPDVTSEVTPKVASDVTPGGYIHRTTFSNDVSQRVKPLASPTAKARRIPDPFMVTSAMKAWAHENVPTIDLGFHTAQFCDYWRGESGQRARKVDWVAAWRNWMRRASTTRTNGNNGHGRPVGLDAVAEYARQKGLVL